MGDIDTPQGDGIMLHELQSHIEYFKRATVNLDSILKKYQHKEKAALEFLKTIRQLTPMQFTKEFEFLNKEYQSLGVIILEYDDIRDSLNQETRIMDEIETTLENGLSDIGLVVQTRDKFRELKYKKNINMETRLMLIYLQLLRQDYDEKSKVEDSPEEEVILKAGIDFMVLSALTGEVDDLMTRLRNLGKLNNPSAGDDYDRFIESAKFIRSLCEDVGKHLDSFVYTMNLEQLNKSAPNKLFKKFIDLTGPIIDFKINLEIKQRQRPKLNDQRPVKEDKHRHQFILESVLPIKQEKVDKSKKYDPFNKDIGQEKAEVKAPAQVGKVKLKTGKYIEVKTFDKKTGGYHHKLQKTTENPDDIKPKIDKNTITDALRNYYRKNWKNLMEDNLHFDISGLDSLMASKGLEKALYDRLKAKALEYDACCTSVSNTLRHVRVSCTKNFRFPN